MNARHSLADLERLLDQLSRMLAAVEKCRDAKLAGRPAPKFPAGRDPLSLVPQLSALAFACFYVEPEGRDDG